MEEMMILLALLLAAIFLQIKYRKILFHSWKERILTTSIVFLVMMSWEFYSKYKGTWLYPGPGMVGVYIFGLPLELYLFYIIAPYFAFTFYETIHSWMDKAKR